ncbi:MAG: BamA/TamA family outer membrane protein [Myxococcales bacterium]|nr:BamA/TamA family outer membrane protein [Myxococcales bacterium]
MRNRFDNSTLFLQLVASSVPIIWVWTLLFALLWAGGIPSTIAQTEGGPAVAGSPCAGFNVDTLLLSGCDFGTCAQRETQAQLLDFVRSFIGPTVDDERLTQLESVLQTLGHFQAVTVECQARQGHAHIHISGQPTWVISELGFTGNSSFYDDEIRKRVFLRPGTLMDPLTEAGKEQLERQRNTILDMYVRAGFVDTNIRLDSHIVEPGRVRIDIHIREGRRNRINRVDISLAYTPPTPTSQPPSPPTPNATGNAEPLDRVPSKAAPPLASARTQPVVRCPRLRSTELIRLGGFNEMDAFTDRAARLARTRLREELQRLGFYRPDVRIDYVPDELLLRVTATYAGCWLIRFRVRESPDSDQSAFRQRERPEWLAVLPFAQSGVFDFDEANAGRSLLQADLENSGLLFADVRLYYRDFRPGSGYAAPDWTIPPEVLGQIHYDVTEGYVTEIHDIEFPGISFFSEDELKGYIKTQEYDFFGTGGYLQHEQMFADLQTIIRLYEDAGFYAVRFVAADGTDSLNRTQKKSGRFVEYTYSQGIVGFIARKPERENIVYIRAPLVEGPRAKIAEVQIEGCSPKNCGPFRAIWPLKSQSAVSEALLKDAIKIGRDWYDALGHLNAAIAVGCSVNGPEGPFEVCKGKNVAQEQVWVRLTIEEGPPVRVGPINIVGHFKTRPSVLLRDLPQPGRILTQRDIREAERLLRNLGTFNTVRVTPSPVVDTEGEQTSALFVQVEEAGARFLDLALGFESFNRVSLTSVTGESGKMPIAASDVIANSIGIADQAHNVVVSQVPFSLPDLLLVAQAEYIDLNLAGLAKEFRVPFKVGLSTTDPLRLIVAAPTFIDRRLFDTQFQFRSTAYGLLDRATDPYDRIETGLELELTESVWKHAYLSQRYNIGTTWVRDLDDPVTDYQDPLLLNKLTLRAAWEDYDTPTHPTRGFGVVVTPGFINSIDLGTNKSTNFIKWEVDGSFAVSFRKKLILAAMARIGGTFDFEGEDLPINERFRLGGGKGVRGFKDGEITQYSKDGRPKDRDVSTAITDRVDGGDYVMSGTVEVRFPLFFSLGPFEMWGAGFFDWGALSEGFGELHAKSFRTTAGGGIRMLLFGRVPIRLDYGAKLETRCAIYYSPNVCGENENTGELDFNILYTF